ncbi:uncharacterized protein NMK_1108 [Novimethylophilus kurashikiensis]|uniref:RDD domain-containing protein n=1 Tax=Novimethylophilus kurashikiensis TaxID=1825523 RepID=A0A2R5F5F8_9PROT|nr:uncharacterized protein NMK_1108 [Novimethylophilus kurashikiensis]
MMRRVAAALYDGLLLAAVLFFSAFLFLIVFGSAVAPPKRYFFQIYLLAVMGAYFVWFWTHGGQTLAMKTWKIQVVAVHGTMTPALAIARYLLAAAGLGFFGAGWWWMLFDREHLPLHDRLTGTRVIAVVPD